MKKKTPIENAADSPRPEVIVDFIFNNGLLFVSVENIGDRPALNVKVRFDEKFSGASGTNVPAMPLFQALEFLAPRKSIRTLLDASAEYFRRGEPTRITARIAFEDTNRHKYNCVLRHNLEIYRDLAYIPEA